MQNDHGQPHLQFILEKTFASQSKAIVLKSKLVLDIHVLNSDLSDREDSIIVKDLNKSKASSTVRAISPVVNLAVTQHTISGFNNTAPLNDSGINADKSLSVIDTDDEGNFKAGVLQEIVLNVMKYPGSITGDMVDYVRPVTRKKPDVIIMHVDTNDLTKGVNTMSKIRKIVSAIQVVDSSRNIQLGFSSIFQRADNDYSKEIKEINTRLKSYCLGEGLNFVDNKNIDV